MQHRTIIITFLICSLFFKACFASKKVTIPILFESALSGTFHDFREQFAKYIRIKRRDKQSLSPLNLALTECSYPVKDTCSHLKLSLLTAACSGIEGPAKLKYLLQKYMKPFKKKNLDTTKVATRKKHTDNQEYFLSLTYFVSLLKLDTLEQYIALFDVIAQARIENILTYEVNFECAKITVDTNNQIRKYSFFESFICNDNHAETHPVLQAFLEAHTKRGIFITDNKTIEEILEETRLLQEKYKSTQST